MEFLPGWNSLEAVRSIHSVLEALALLFFAALVIFDVLAHLAEDHPKDEPISRPRRLERRGLYCFAVAIIAEIIAYPYSRQNDRLSEELDKARVERIESAKEQAAKAELRAIEAALELAKYKAPREIPLEQQHRATTALLRFAGQRYSFTVYPDPEAIGLLQSVNTILTSAGWQRVESQLGQIVVDVGGMTAGQSFDKGVRVFMAPDDSGSTEALKEMSVALTQAGIPCSANRTELLKGKTPAAIMIQIGKKP